MIKIADSRFNRHQNGVRACVFFMLLGCISAAPLQVLASEPGAGVSSHQELSAQEQEELVALIDEGQASFDAGDFAAALDAFKRAYEIYPHPDLTYRIARCYEQLDQEEQAIAAYEEFLRRAPEARERGRVEQTIARLKDRESRRAPAALKIVVVPPDAQVYVDNKPQPRPVEHPGEYRLTLAPGAYDIWVGKDEFLPHAQAISLKPGDDKTVSVVLAVAQGEQASGRAAIIGPATLSGVAALAAATAVVSYFYYADRARQIESWDAQKSSIPRPNSYDSTHDDMRFYGALTWTAAAVTAASLGAAVAWWWLSKPDEIPAQPSPTDGSATLSTRSPGSSARGVSLDSLSLDSLSLDSLSPGAGDLGAGDFGAWDKDAGFWGLTLSGRY